MTNNPYYRMLGLTGGGQTELAQAILQDAQTGVFQVEGRKAPIAGRAAGLSLTESDVGGSFLCLGNSAGWFVVCRLEED